MIDGVVKISVVESDPFARRAITAFFANFANVHLDAMYSSGSEAIADAVHATPHVIVTDLDSPGVGGLDFVHAAGGLARPPRIVCFMSIVPSNMVRTLLEAGVRGLVLKDDHPDLLLHAVRLAYTDDILVSPKLISGLLGSLPLRGLPPADFSDKELDLVRLVGLGLDNSAISDRLHLSPNTVKTYVSRLLRRSGCRDRAMLVARAHQWGLVD